MKNNPLVTALLIILFAGLGFFGGMKYQQSKVPATGTRGAGQFAGRAGAGAGANRGGGQIVGDILSADTNSITVKLADGSSKIILVGSTTSINKATAGSKTDLTVGTRVGVFGQTNADGSVTAQNIQLNPMTRNATPSATPTK